jgi:mannose-6-phosphate isomerase
MFNNYHTEDFPLLVKFLDAEDDLSIQVHPNNEQAKKLENEANGKSEC